MRGQIQSLAQAPALREPLVALKTTGPIDYVLIQSRIHRKQTLLIGGITDEPSLVAFAERNSLEYIPSGGAYPPDKIISLRGATTSIRADFGRDDALVSGNHPKMGWVEVHFHRPTAQFTAIINAPTAR